MRPVKILSVCGSGTVSSAILSNKLKDILTENGYDMTSTEVSPGGVDSEMSSGDYDLIIYTSPVSGDYDVPVLNGTGLLIGMNEDAFIEGLLTELKKLDLGS